MAGRLVDSNGVYGACHPQKGPPFPTLAACMQSFGVLIGWGCNLVAISDLSLTVCAARFGQLSFVMADELAVSLARLDSDMLALLAERKVPDQVLGKHAVAGFTIVLLCWRAQMSQP
eukprot:3226183-Amphidinium_carterae.1